MAQQEEIVTCGCKDTDTFAKNAFRLLFERKDYPPLRHHQTFSQNTEVLEMVTALERTKRPYAYYFNGEEVWDLMKGVKVR